MDWINCVDESSCLFELKGSSRSKQLRETGVWVVCAARRCVVCGSICLLEDDKCMMMEKRMKYGAKRRLLLLPKPSNKTLPWFLG